MRNFKVLVALVLAVMMTLALVGSAMADGVTPATDKTTENDGSVTVSNPTVGQTYTLYKLFNADMGTNSAITYTLPSGKTAADLTYNSKSWFELNSNGFIVAKDSTGENWAKDPDAIAWAKQFAGNTPAGSAITKTEDNTVSWTGLTYGYYFVDTTLGAFISVDSANKAATITEKNTPPTIDKEITGVTTPGGTKSTATLGTGDNTNDPGNGANEKAIAQVGDTVSYKLTVAAKPGALNYKVTDVLTNLKLVASSVKVNDTAYASSTIVDKTASSVVDAASTFTIVFTKAYLDTIDTATSITIEYDAIITGTAVIVGEEGNPNTATLTYGNKPEPDSSTDDAKVYTAKITVIKNDNNGSGLAGAEFALKNSSGKYYVYNTTTGVVTWTDAVTDATKYTSGSDGKLNGEFKGLPNGSYILEETVVPEGYNAIDPNDNSLKFTIAGNNYTNTNLIQGTAVVNNAGTTLPSTGGIGTTIFYVAGIVLVLGAAAVIIARRKSEQE